MHAVFMISGVRKFVDEFFNWLDYRFYPMPFKNPNLMPVAKDASGNIAKEGIIHTTARVRYGIYGTYELCFPEEFKDVVLTTLRFHEAGNFYADEYQGKPLLNLKNKAKNFLGKMEINAFRKLIGCDSIPEFKTQQAIAIPEEVMQNIRIVPVGVRYDEKEWVAPSGLVHERI